MYNFFEFCNSKLKLTEFNYPYNHFFIHQLYEIWQLKQVMILFCNCGVKLRFPSNVVKMWLLLMCIVSNLLKSTLTGSIWGWEFIAKNYVINDHCMCVDCVVFLWLPDTGLKSKLMLAFLMIFILSVEFSIFQ